MTTPLNVFDAVLPKSFVAPVRSSAGDLIFSGRPDKYVPIPSGVSTVSVSTPAASKLIVNFANGVGSAQVSIGTVQKSGIFKVAARSGGVSGYTNCPGKRISSKMSAWRLSRLCPALSQGGGLDDYTN